MTTTPPLNDSDVVQAMKITKAIGVTIHIRGDDKRVVVEVKDKKSRRIIGGIELKERIRRHENNGI